MPPLPADYLQLDIIPKQTRDGRWKLVARGPGGAWELYDSEAVTQTQKPFILYLAHTSPHWLLQTMENLTMKAFSYLVAVALLTVLVGHASAADQPNIVFFFADDQTTSTLGCYGHPIVQTPNIDSLAAGGVRFQNAFVSQSICWVSRTSILTGLTGRSYGTPENPDLTRADAAHTLYSDLLRQHGYRTGFFGKWHAKMPPGYKPADHFDEFENISRNPFYKKQSDGSLRHETDLIVDRGIDFIKQQPKDKPFVLNLWFNACHAEDGDCRPGRHFAWPQSANCMYDDAVMPPPRLNDPADFENLPDFFQTSITRKRFFWRWNSRGVHDGPGVICSVSSSDNEKTKNPFGVCSVNFAYNSGGVIGRG